MRAGRSTWTAGEVGGPAVGEPGWGWLSADRDGHALRRAAEMRGPQCVSIALPRGRNWGHNACPSGLSIGLVVHRALSIGLSKAPADPTGLRAKLEAPWSENRDGDGYLRTGMDTRSGMDTHCAEPLKCVGRNACPSRSPVHRAHHAEIGTLAVRSSLAEPLACAS